MRELEHIRLKRTTAAGIELQGWPATVGTIQGGNEKAMQMECCGRQPRNRIKPAIHPDANPTGLPCNNCPALTTGPG